MARRSVMFTPGDDPEMLRTAPEGGADTLVFDLEDGVAPDRKAEARATVRDALDDPDVNPEAEVCVRVTPPPTTDEDLRTVLAGGTPDAVLLPMVDDREDVETLVGLLRERDAAVPVLALVETARGVLNAPEIAAHPRVDALLLGAEDLAADVGATRTDGEHEVAYARGRVVTAAAAADIDAVDAVYTDLEDREGLRETTRRAAEMGYDGRMVVHPAQVPVVNAAFTPDPDRVEWAERVLVARTAAEREGRGVFRVDDQMIDAPLVAQAERIVARARAAGIEVDVEDTTPDGGASD
ncbi:CoA ester lyase [Halobacteriales archaeon SW_7_71_33]|nr:MAG: CoA ester lyase [Halobacteriales archaeon SW_7_71_33]